MKIHFYIIFSLLISSIGTGFCMDKHNQDKDWSTLSLALLTKKRGTLLEQIQRMQRAGNTPKKEYNKKSYELRQIKKAIKAKTNNPETKKTEWRIKDSSRQTQLQQLENKKTSNNEFSLFSSNDFLPSH